jgi:hypothetical protein
VLIEKTNILHSEYTTSINEENNFQSTLIDDNNIHLQTFFQHLEQLLQIDLKSKKKRNIYFLFFVVLRSKILIK